MFNFFSLFGIVVTYILLAFLIMSGITKIMDKEKELGESLLFLGVLFTILFSSCLVIWGLKVI